MQMEVGCQNSALWGGDQGVVGRVGGWGGGQRIRGSAGKGLQAKRRAMQHAGRRRPPNMASISTSSRREKAQVPSTHSPLHQVVHLHRPREGGEGGRQRPLVLQPTLLAPLRLLRGGATLGSRGPVLSGRLPVLARPGAAPMGRLLGAGLAPLQGGVGQQQGDIGVDNREGWRRPVALPRAAVAPVTMHSLGTPAAPHLARRLAVEVGYLLHDAAPHRPRLNGDEQRGVGQGALCKWRAKRA